MKIIYIYIYIYIYTCTHICISPPSKHLIRYKSYIENIDNRPITDHRPIVLTCLYILSPIDRVPYTCYHVHIFTDKVADDDDGDGGGDDDDDDGGDGDGDGDDDDGDDDDDDDDDDNGGENNQDK